MDKISDLRLFARLAETLSFTQTAAALDVSRASVGRAIERMESQLGTRLIQRTTRKVVLTPDGAAVLARCLKLIAEVDDMAQMFDRASARPKGVLRVNVPTRMGRRLFVPRLPEFLARYPDIDLDFATTDRPVDLVGEGFDCVIRVGDQTASGLISRTIGSLRMINCASPDYLVKFGTPEAAEDLTGHRAVGYVSPRGGRDFGWEYEENGVTRARRMPCALRVNNAELYIAAAVAGLGLIQVPAYDVADLIASGDLVEVLQAQPCGPMPVAFVSPDRPSLVPTVNAFAEWASEVFQAAMAQA